MDARPWVRVWDIVVRVFHWMLVAAFTVAWLTRHGSEDIHHLAGYAAFGLVSLRVIWGIAGTHYARFTQFTRSPRTVVGYLRDVAIGREARFIGHNPAGGAMVLALLFTMATTAATGWLSTTDQFWGVEWVSRFHEFSAKLLLLLVLGHLAGVALASFRHRENLVWGMLSGMKRAAEEGDIE
jgi:cytochrome b